LKKVSEKASKLVKGELDTEESVADKIKAKAEEKAEEKKPQSLVQEYRNNEGVRYLDYEGLKISI
jgi:hypothetical protein